jgi:competence protein ComEA
MFFNLMKAAVVVAALAVSGSAMAAGGKGLHLVPRDVSGVININTASAHELELLPGIGPRTAKLIVAYREKTPFKASHEIVHVKGVGQGILAKVKPYLTIAGPTTLTATSHGKASGTAAPAAKAAPQPSAKAK